MPSIQAVSMIIDQATGKPRPLNLKIASGVQEVNIGASLPLPSGAATEAKQDANIVQTTAINTALAGTIVVDGSGVTQPVSATTLPLPTGAASEITLASIDTTLSTGTVNVTSSLTKETKVLSNAQVVVSGDFSTSAQDCTNLSKVAIAGTFTGSNEIEIWISHDDVTYYKWGQFSMYPNNGVVGAAFDAPFSYYKLKYTDSGTATVDAFASN